MNKNQSYKWQTQDTLWVFTLFGTAVGAGILFLPIEAGLDGIWPLVVLTLLIIPMVYLSHKFFSYLILSATHETDDITAVVRDHFGFRIGTLITFLYFLAIYPILLIYGVGLTNSIESIIVHQLHLRAPNRVILSFLITTGMIAIILFGEKIVLRVTEFLVYPLAFMLLSVSIYLIPYWNIKSIIFVPPKVQFIKDIVFILPILIFSFNHSPAISSFVLAQRKSYHKYADQKVFNILSVTSVVLFVFVMFFVFSCVLTLSPEDMKIAKHDNISVMSYLAKSFDRTFFSIIASLIAVTAIITSFFGHYMGAREGLKGLLSRFFESNQIKIKNIVIDNIVLVFFFLSIWGISYLNPSILTLLEAFVGPIIAILLFVVPVVAIYKIKTLAQYRGHFLSHIFIFATGLIAVSVMMFHIMQIFFIF